MAIVIKTDLADPLSLNVAGYSVIFLIGCIPLYWFILFLYENKAFRCRDRRRADNEGNDVMSSF